MRKKRKCRAICVSDKLRQENNYFKYFSDSNEIERFAGEVRHQFELLDYQIPIAHILDKVGFKIYKENVRFKLCLNCTFCERIMEKILLAIHPVALNPCRWDYTHHLKSH